MQSCHDLLAWLIPHLDKFPRVRRFTLGERRPIGLGKGKFTVPDEFFDPLPDEILDAFEGKEP